MGRFSAALTKAWRLFNSRISFEALIWVAALVYLAIHNPYTQSEFTICPFRNLGFHDCPGCGLGRSVSFLLHGDIARSFQTHILGIPATIILLFRTFSLSKSTLKRNFITR